MNVCQLPARKRPSACVLSMPLVGRVPSHAHRVESALVDLRRESACDASQLLSIELVLCLFPRCNCRSPLTPAILMQSDRNARLQPDFLVALLDGRGQRKSARRAFRLKRCSDSNRLHLLQSEDE